MKAEKPLLVRKGLTDVTNSQLPPPFPPKLHVDKLLQENGALIKLIEAKDKMIEVSEAALQKLRVNYQKLQAQNTTLAKSNTQFLTELNNVRDKLKVLQHELACKNVVLKARDEEPKEKVDIQMLRSNVALQEDEEEEEEKETTKQSCDQIIANKPSTQNSRKNQQRQSLGAPNTRAKDDNKLEVPNRRQSLRRQSGRFQTQLPEPEENLFEIEEAKYPITQSVAVPKPDQKLEMTCCAASKEGEESISDSASVNRTAKRSSVGRPLRRAAEKVQSYKEIPVNVKMRRME